MTAYDRITTMTKDELQKLIRSIYAWGHINEQGGVDDKCFYEHLLDLDARHIDSIIDTLDNLELYNIRVYPLNDNPPIYLRTKFFGVEDATQYLIKHIKDIAKLDNVTYISTDALYKIIPCSDKL